MTIHFIVEGPPPRLRKHLRPNDLVVDVSWEQAAATVLEPELDVKVISTAVSSEANFLRTRDEFLDWVGEITETMFRGRTLVDWLEYDDHLSLWWLLGLTVKSVPNFDLWRAFAAVIWLETSTEAPRVLEEFATHSQCLVWAKRKRAADLVADAVRRKSPGATVLSRPEIGAAQSWFRAYPLRAARLMLDVLLGEWTNLRLGLQTRVLGHRGEDHSAEDAEGTDAVDVVVPTVPTSWYRSEDGELINRYLDGVEEQVRSAGVSMIFVPACTGGRSLRYLHSRFGDETKLKWDLLYREPLFSVRLLWRLMKLRRSIAPLRRDFVRDHSPGFRGLDTAAWFDEQFHAITSDVGFQDLYLYESMRAVFRELKPMVVLYKDEFYPAGRAVSAAVPPASRSWAFQHGTISRDHLVYVNDGSWVGDAGTRTSSRMPAPDLFFCYGRYSKEVVTLRGYPEEKVKCIGSLRHDVWYDRESAASSRPVEDLGLPADGRRVVTLFAQNPRTIEDWLGILVGGISEFDVECHLVIKPHPRFDVSEQCELTLRSLGWSDFTIVHGHLTELLRASDVAVTGGSTTGLEAVLVGTPVITIVSRSGFERFPYAADGVAIPAHDPRSMAEALSRSLAPDYRAPWLERRTAFLRRHLSPNDGGATDHLLRLIQAARDESGRTGEG